MNAGLVAVAAYGAVAAVIAGVALSLGRQRALRSICLGLLWPLVLASAVFTTEDDARS